MNDFKIKLYPLDQLYFGYYNKTATVGFLSENLERLFVEPGEQVHKPDFNEKFKPLSPFLDVLVENNLDVLLTDVDGKQLQQLSCAKINDLLRILWRKNNLNQVLEQKNEVISNNATNIISDLLGLNLSTPSTPFNFKERLGTNEIVVSAKKMFLFKKFLLEFIRASLIANPVVILTYEKGSPDYRILRSLKKAKIEQTEMMKNNTFSVNINQAGKIMVNDINVNEYQRNQEHGFQKTIKFQEKIK